jgi:hypothetical protein
MTTPGEAPRELARYLPLSMRPRYDESAVSSDWGARLTALEAAVASLGPAGPGHFAFFREIELARQRRRVRVQDLGRALVEAYELTGDRLEVDPVVSGAVCLARTVAAPVAIRAVVRGRTLVATDAGWELGTGPAISGTARELVLFVYGRSGLPGS